MQIQAQDTQRVLLVLKSDDSRCDVRMLIDTGRGVVLKSETSIDGSPSFLAVPEAISFKSAAHGGRAE